MTNRDENAKFDEAVRRIESRLRRKLDKDERQRLHREISGEHYSLAEIVGVGFALFPE